MTEPLDTSIAAQHHLASPRDLAPQHALIPMSGRDPHEDHRSATPLELLFDLTFVVGFGAAAAQFAHYVGEGHIGTALLGFAFAMFAICWAWINYSWFASAYDTDDWGFRLATFVEMVGVIVLTLGLPSAFSSIEKGDYLENGVVVLGYVIMRLALVGLWFRAARQDPKRRKTCLTYAGMILVAQAGWIALYFAQPGWTVTALAWALLLAIELAGPIIAEHISAEGGTPWHAHHMAERYGLLTIIALGEGVIGTVASVSAIVAEHGWSFDAIMASAAGIGLTFGMWWLYFILPAAPILQRHRDRAFLWSYLHIPLFAAIAATGAGLDIVAHAIEHKAHIGPTAVIAATAVPVGAFIFGVYALYASLLHQFDDKLHTGLILASLAVLAGTIALAALGVSLPVCLAILTIAPAISVIGYELIGVHHTRAALTRELAKNTDG